MTTRTVLLPRPLSHQTDILLDDHRFKVIDAGRRFGKTLLGLIAVLDGHGPLVMDDGTEIMPSTLLGVTDADGRISEGFGAPGWKPTKPTQGVRPKFKGALHGGAIWWVAPTLKIAKKIWRDLKASLCKWGGDLIKNEVEKRIEFPGGGSIEVRSAHDPEGLRGEGLDGVVIDEAAYCHDDTWMLTLRPTLADREGWGILISTPKGLNWFYDEFCLGSDLYGKRDPDYRSWKRPTSDNPTIKPAELDKMRRKMGLYKFQRECLAEFEVREGGMFRREWFRFYKQDGEWIQPLPTPCWCTTPERRTCAHCAGTGTIEPGPRVHKSDLRVFLTADLAGSVTDWSDYTVVFVWGRSPDGTLFVLEVFRGKLEIPALAPMLRRMFDQWGAESIWIEDSGPLVKVNHEARNVQRLPVFDVPVGKKDKVTRAMPAAAAVEAGRVLLLQGASWVNDVIPECCAFPDPSVHDDVVDGLQLGVRASPARPGLNPARVKPQAVDEDNVKEGSWLVGR